ncbi:MAG: hypothetical protein ACHQAQ_15920, partial [Hyphomicrobiales bacterium]
ARASEIRQRGEDGVRATIIPWGSHAKLSQPGGPCLGKELSLAAILPTPAGIRRPGPLERDRLVGPARGDEPRKRNGAGGEAS